MTRIKESIQADIEQMEREGVNKRARKPQCITGITPQSYPHPPDAVGDDEGQTYSANSDVITEEEGGDKLDKPIT
jgi:hypothetical protein